MMAENTTIEALKTDITNAAWDIKAEAILSLAMNSGLEPDEFLVGCDDLFSREFSKDVSLAEIKEDGQKRQLLQLHLSRTGLYDQLPQGLFYQPRKTGSVTEMSADYKTNKKKEDEIRKFFLPFENDFFLQRLHIEEEEARTLEGLKSGLLNEYFTQFWNLPPGLARSFAAPFVLLIPYAHQIAGDIELTTHSLEQLLGERVVIEKKTAQATLVDSDLTPGMGEGILGLDMVCGEYFYEDSIVLDIAVGPLRNSEITEYLQGGQRKLLIETFSQFFIPAGTEINVSVNVEPARRHMTIKRGNAPVLGYSSVLGHSQTI